MTDITVIVTSEDMEQEITVPEVLDVTVYPYPALASSGDIVAGHDIDFTVAGNGETTISVELDINPDTIVVGNTSDNPLTIKRNINANGSFIIQNADFKNSSNQDTTFTRFRSDIVSNTAGSENGRFWLDAMIDGTMRNLISGNKFTVQINSEKLPSVDFNVCGDNDTYLLFADSGNDSITIGSNIELAKFGIDGNADEVQFKVQGNSTQTNKLAIFEQSDGSEVFAVENIGTMIFGRDSLTSAYARRDTATAYTGHGFSFQMKNNGDSWITYARLESLIRNNGAGVENGSLSLYASRGGALQHTLILNENGIYINPDSLATVDFQAKGDNYLMIDIDASNDSILVSNNAAGKVGFFGKTPVVQRAKANYNNWAALSDLVNALVDLGLLDAA